MKKWLLISSILIWAASSFAQINPQAAPLQAPEDGWKVNTNATLEVGEMTLSNWAAGGQSTFSLKGNTSFHALYDKNKILWHNTLDFSYNFYKTENRPLQRLNDNFIASSMLGYRLAAGKLIPGDVLHIGALVTLVTQVAPGYDPRVQLNPLTGQPVDPGKGLKVGSFLSPGYLYTGAGFEYRFSVMKQDMIKMVYAPIMMKQTYVIDGDIRDLEEIMPIYGNNGKRVKTAVGTSLSIQLSAPLALISPSMQNLFFSTNSLCFVNYNDPALDLDATLTLTGKINKYLSALITTRFIFNDDTDTDLVATGKQKGLQFMGNFGIGLNISL